MKVLGLFLFPVSCALFPTKGLVSVGYAAQKSPLSAQLLWRIGIPVQAEQVFLRISVILQRCWRCLCCPGKVGPYLVREQQERDESRGTVPFLSCPPQLIGLSVSMVMCGSQDLL